MKRTFNRGRRQAGFTLIELVVSVVILVVIVGAIFSRIDSVQKAAKTESTKLDQTQESREFVDQFVRDIHMSGYPISTMYQNNPNITNKDQNTAAGLVAASPTSIRFEGDVYGNGLVYSVLYSYYATDPNSPPDPNCPCLRRSVTLKQAGDPVSGQSLPQYYTEVQNLVNTTGVFSFFNAAGGLISVGTGVDVDSATGAATIQSIDAIKVDISTQSAQKDLTTGQPIVLSLSAIAELVN
jgi:prepilin-type N-terminal cleavage/methylation domain-containing protein